MAHRLKKVKVLHIPGADLDDVHIPEEGQLGKVHQLGDDGQAGFLLGGPQVGKALLPQALEGVGRGTGLKGPAPEHGGPAGLYRLCDGHHLLLRFHRAGSRHDGEAAAANLGIAHLDDGILRVELAVGVFVGLLDPLYVLHNVQGGDEVNIQLGGVPHQAQDGVGLPDAFVDAHPLFLEPADKALHLVRVGIML